MTTYPDPDDMTAAKRGSDHDRADAWRIIVHDLRVENERLRVSLTMAQNARRTFEDALAEAQARADGLYHKRLPCAEAEVAQERYERAEALLRYVLLEDMEHGDRGREPLDGLIERLGACAERGMDR